MPRSLVLYLNSFIGGKAEQISAYQFSNITHIKCDTVLRVLKRSVSLQPLRAEKMVLLYPI